MALSLSDLLKSQAELKEKEEAEAGQPASMSMAQLKELAASTTMAAPKTKADAALTKIYQELRKHTAILNEIKGKKDGYQVTREDRIEAARADSEQTKLLRQIAENTGGINKPKPDTKDKKSLELPSLFNITTGLALAISGVIAAFKAQVKTIKLFAEALMPTSWLNAIRKSTASFLSSLSMAYDMAKASVLEQFNKASAFVTDVVKSIKTFMSGESGIAKAITGIFSYVKNVFTTLVKPFSELIKYINKVASLTGIFEPIVNTIKQVVSWGKNFGGMISKFVPMLTKIFYPITVLLTLWDTVKGAFAGWEEGGLVGAVKGAISGFFKSLVGGFLDGIKWLVSGILGLLGFDKLEKMLDSFSFSDIIGDFFDAVFAPLQFLQDVIMHPIDTIRGIFDKMVSWFTDFEIPKIGFTVFGKEFSVGPWHPFREEKKAPTGEGGEGQTKKTAQSESTTPAPTTEKKSTKIPTQTATDVSGKPISGKIQAQQTGPGQYTAVSSGVTSDDIVNHPNYKKYYDEALGSKTGPDAVRVAKKVAWMKVERDLAKQAAAGQTPTTGTSETNAAKVTAAQAAVEQQAPIAPIQETKSPATNIQAIVAPGGTEVELSGITSDDIINNPNYQAYYQEALQRMPGANSSDPAKRSEAERFARKRASLKVNGDIARSAAASSTSATIPGTTPTPSSQPATQAASVYDRSGENAAAATQPQATPQMSVVSAPTTNVNNTTHSVIRLPSRNTDSTLQDFYKNRYAF